MKKHLQHKNASHPSSKDDENPPNIDIGASTVRRNPPRHARPRMYGATPAKESASISSKSSSVPIPFHIDDLVKQEIPPPKKSVTAADASENMKVFLRIRPLNVMRRDPAKNADKIGGIRGKGIITKKHEKCTKKKSLDQEACLVVNGTNSVTLTPPTAFLAGAKRAKCEVYDGFSHVFTSESLQCEVYKLVMGPLIRDFMEGKSGLLAAMGPTGSGKTHTLFGTTREPGLVPLALQQLFSEDTKTDCSFAMRSYCISMFEICSTQGKSERIFDLTVGGLDSSPQQSTIEGVQEVMISSITEAESVIACGMFKRATAATDANDQSSRSQCIINIRHAPKSSHHNHDKLKTTIFTIVDLAGAEKERRTGIQGSRLVESNFINNTSMVFGLSLRSLLEHQKNRKRTLQKHFLNSQLTKYLRDYFEGKKRMTLLITAKPGEDDYSNTSFLLRQVSPYMKIKFTIEEFPDAQNLKRSIVSSSRLDLAKRRKHNDSKADRIKKNEPPALTKETDARNVEDTTIPDHSVLCSDSVGNFHEPCDEEHHADIQRLKRECHVMNCFMRALWNVLKEYKQKVEVADEEVIEARRLKESLRNVHTENILLKQELEVLWSLCSLRDSSSVHSISVQECDIPSIPCSEMNMMCDGNISKKVEVDRTKVNKDPKSTTLEREPISEIQEKLRKNEATSLPSSTQLGKECSEVIVTSSMENDTVQHEDIKTFSEDGISLVANVETADKAFRKKSPLQVVGNISREPNVHNKHRRRLLPPASAMLLKEFSGLDLDDRNAKGKKEAGRRKESQRLLQLVQSAKK